MRWLIGAIVGLGLAVAASIAFDLYPGLRGGAGWQWTYVPSLYPGAVLALAVSLVSYVGGALIMLRRGWLRGVVMWAVVGGAAIAYLVTATQGDAGYTLFTRTVSPVQTGASALATRIMGPEGTLPTLQRWPEVMRGALDANLIHFTTSPPGQVLFHQWAADFLNSPALAGITNPVSRDLRLYQCADTTVMRADNGEIASAGLGIWFPVLAALLAVPLYLTTRDLSGDRYAAARVAAWGALIPAVGLFAPTWNTLYPALCLFAFWLLLRALITRHLGWALAAGVVMSVTTFLNFAVLPMLLLMGLYTLGHTIWHDRRADGLRALAWPVTIGVVFGVGLLSVWMVFTLATGVSPLDILRETFTAHGELVVREYLPWLVLHPWDVALFTGIPAAALAVWGAVRAARQPVGMLAVFTLSMAATVVLVNVVGIVQGENARILIYYMPLLLIMGALPRRSFGLRAELPLMGAQAVVLLAMAYALYVVPLDMNPPTETPRTDIGGLGDLPWTPVGGTLTSAAYVGDFSLTQYRTVGDPSVQAITFEFEWLGGTPTERPYQIELIARTVDPEVGALEVEPLRWTPQGGAYPPTCWRAGQVIRDVVVLNVPAVSAPVVWDVSLRAVDERTGDVMLSDGADLPLAPVRYP